jgi:peptidoglycan-associated lipoprotein
MWSKKLLNSVALTMLSLSLVSCGGNSSSGKKTSSVATKEADVVVQNAAELDSFQEGSSDSHIMAPRAKQIYYFDFDSSALNHQIRNALKEQARYLKEHPKTKVILEGHTDIRGTHEYNIDLGSRRAGSVANYLYGQGVGRAQLETVSYGKEKPVAEGNSEKAHAKNRRVELTYQSAFHM